MLEHIFRKNKKFPSIDRKKYLYFLRYNRTFTINTTIVEFIKKINLFTYIITWNTSSKLERKNRKKNSGSRLNLKVHPLIAPPLNTVLVKGLLINFD